MGVKVRELKGKGWYVFINWRNQRKAKCFGPNKATAKEFAKKLEARLKWADVSGEPLALSQPNQEMPTVKAYLEEWLRTHVKVHCKGSTYDRYKEVIDQQLVPAFGDRPLHLLKREDLKRFIARHVEAKKARGTIQNYLVPLKAAYNHAKDDGLITSNPADRFTRLLQRGQDRRKHIQPLTREELAAVLSYAEEHDAAYFPVFLCAARTGLRQGELIGLEWGDVDFRGSFLEVRRSVVHGVQTSPKNNKIRRVDLSPQLAAVLERQKELQQLQAMDAGEGMPPWVFLSPEGVRSDERNIRRAWYRCLDRAGVRRVRFHDLRHTFASQLIDEGAHPKYIQEQMGHSSIQVTMDIYGHLFPSGHRGWVAKLDSAGKASPNTAESATQAQPDAVAVEPVGAK